MTVRVVTDSAADIPAQVARELGITVIPLFVHFGEEVYKEGIDINTDEFYRRLVNSRKLPTTAAPSPGMFAELYNNLAAETNEIISIHISSKLSVTYNAATMGRDQAKGGCRIEVIDSLSASMGFGLLAVAAARAARAGANLDQIAEMVRKAIPGSHLFGLLDTLEYLYKGGRIGKAQAFFGSALKVKPILSVRDGEVHPVERVRTRSRAMERLCELVKGFPRIGQMSIVHSTTPDEAEALAQRLAPVFPRERMYMARFGSVLGTYVGPGCLAVTFVEGESPPSGG